MKEPILSREEVLGFASDAFGIDYDRLDTRFEKYASLIESAILEKLCGEPVGFVEQFDLDQLKLDQVSRIFPTKESDADIPLYTLNRSKA